jgi:DNA-binding CsgD family transcriptional regulator
MEPFDQQRLTSALTAAAVDPSRWTEALEAVAACTNSYGALVFPIAGNLPIICATASMEKSFEVYTSEGWMDRDERYRGTAKFLDVGVATDDDCMSPEARKRSPFYQEFLGSCRLKDFAGVRIGRGGLVWNLSLQRRIDQDPFSATELKWLAEISNSLDSIAQISAALGLARGEAALDAFDFSERAALLLDRQGNVVRVNVAAERLIGADFHISAGRVRLRDRKSSNLLAQSIKAMLWSRKAHTAPPVVAQKLSGGKLVIYPMRLPGLTTSPLSAFHAVLVITDTDQTNSAAMTTLQDVFDLTAAESRLAVAIARGVDLETFSVERKLSKETLRNQLKCIFAKTGTNRQAQLAVMLSTLIPKK